MDFRKFLRLGVNRTNWSKLERVFYYRVGIAHIGFNMKETPGQLGFSCFALQKIDPLVSPRCRQRLAMVANGLRVRGLTYDFLLVSIIKLSEGVFCLRHDSGTRVWTREIQFF